MKPIRTSKITAAEGDYLQWKGFDPGKCAPFVRRVCYQPRRFALGMHNQSGGYELRWRDDSNQEQRGQIGQRDISLFQPRTPSTKLHIFLGADNFFAFLSGVPFADPAMQSYLIIHYPSLFTRAAEVAKSAGMINACVWSDRQDLVDILCNHLPGQVGTMEQHYAGFDSLAAWRKENAPGPLAKLGPSTGPAATLRL